MVMSKTRTTPVIFHIAAGKVGKAAVNIVEDFSPFAHLLPYFSMRPPIPSPLFTILCRFFHSLNPTHFPFFFLSFHIFPAFFRPKSQLGEALDLETMESEWMAIVGRRLHRQSSCYGIWICRHLCRRRYRRRYRPYCHRYRRRHVHVLFNLVWSVVFFDITVFVITCVRVLPSMCSDLCCRHWCRHHCVWKLSSLTASVVVFIVVVVMSEVVFIVGIFIISYLWMSIGSSINHLRN